MWIDPPNIQEMYINKNKTKQKKLHNHSNSQKKEENSGRAEEEKNERIKSWGYKLSIVLLGAKGRARFAQNNEETA